MNKLELEIIKPTESKKLKVLWIEVEGIHGNFIVGPDHIPLVSLLSTNGKISFELENGKKESIRIFGGIIKIKNNKATILLN